MEIAKSRIASAAGGFEPQRKNNWLVTVEPPGLDISLLQFGLSTFAFPEINVPTKTTPWCNEVRKWGAGPVEYPSVSLNYFDYVDEEIAAMVNEWHNLLWTPSDGKIHLCREYKGNGSLLMYAPDMDSYLRTWTLHGVYLRGFKHGDWDMGSGDQILITANIEIDWMTPENLRVSA